MAIKLPSFRDPQALGPTAQAVSEVSAGCPSPDIYLSPSQLADRAPFSVKSLETMRARGKGPPWRLVSRRIVYKWSEVVVWIEQGGNND